MSRKFQLGEHLASGLELVLSKFLDSRLVNTRAAKNNSHRVSVSVFCVLQPVIYTKFLETKYLFSILGFINIGIIFTIQIEELKIILVEGFFFWLVFLPLPQAA